MSTVVADLVARLRADTTDVTRGAQEAKQQLQGIQAQAEQTTRALEIMAGQYAKLHGGTAAGAMEMFQRAGVQPTAAAMAEATRAAEQTAAAVAKSVAPSQAVAKAAADTVGPTQAAALAAAQIHGGWSASESSIVRFGSALVGVNLGISLIAGAGRLVHQVVGDIVTSQLDWERSLVNLSGLYGQVGTQAAALANAQANLPGVLGSQQEFAQAAINASALRLRYGLPQQTADQLITTGGRVAYATGMTDPGARAQLQQQILAATQTGAPLPAQYGVYTDPEAVARRLGFQGAQSLQAFTPQQLMEARGAIVSEGMSAFADRAGANQRAALEAVTRADQARNQAQTAIQGNLERPQTGVIQGPTAAERSLTQQILMGGQASPAAPPQATPYGPTAPANIQGLAAMDAEQRVMQSANRYAAALADSAKVTEEARKTIEQLGKSTSAAGAQLLQFFGSLDDRTSIARGDILAQAQAGVGARSIGPNPLAYQTQGDLRAQGANRAAQDAWQTYTSALGQQETTNAIRRNLQDLAAQQGPGLESQRSAAQQALAEETRRGPAAVALRNAEQADALAQLRVAEQQSNVEAIALQYRERSLNVEKDTLGIRTTATQISIQNLNTTQALIQAQQAALPSGLALSNLTYEQQRTALLAQTRTAGLLTGQDVSGIPSYDDLIKRSITLRYQQPGVHLAALDASQAVNVAGFASTAGGLAAGTAQIPITRADLNLALQQYADDPARLAAELRLTSAEGGTLASGRQVRSATANLANVNLTVNVGGTIRLADDAIAAAAQSAYDQVEQALREGLAESDQSGVPASPQLAGARR